MTDQNHEEGSSVETHAVERVPVLENASGEVAIVFPAGRSPKGEAGAIRPIRLVVDRESGLLTGDGDRDTGFALASDAIALFSSPRRCMALEAGADGKPVFAGWLALA